jgi:hypothetical protein
MEDYSVLIHNTFELHSVRDAQHLFEICIRNAFPTNTFRGLDLVRFLRENRYIEGKSWNHVFEIQQEERDGVPVWSVHCHRVTLGRSPDKHVYLDYNTLTLLD